MASVAADDINGEPSLSHLEGATMADQAAPPQPVAWGIHAGKTGDADTLFLQNNYIGLGWLKVGDLALLAPNRDAFKEEVSTGYPGRTPGSVANSAGQLFRFVHEMQNEDFVVYPSKIDKRVHVGQVKGSYTHDLNIEPGYPHLRAVEWLRSKPRTVFSQGALYEIGSALSFFQVKSYAEEFLAVVDGTDIPGLVQEDETVGFVTTEVEQATRDFVVKQLAKLLKGHPLQGFVAGILRVMGYRTTVSREGPDHQIDILAHRDELALEPPIVKVQVKSSEGNVGEPAVAALSGNIDGQGEYGLFVTLGAYTKQAREFARTKANLRLVDGEELVDLVLEHYESLDPMYKGLIPLKRVYVPEVLEEEGE